MDGALFVSEGFDPVRPITLSDGNADGFVTTRREYDRSSRPTLFVEDDGEVRETVYDGADRPVEYRDQAGNRAVITYDRNSNPVRLEEFERATDDLVPEECFTTLSVYDQLDRLVRLTDNLGQTTRFSWDSRDNLTTTSDPEGELVADPLGLFAGEINRPGNTRAWFHDGIDRVVREVHDLREGARGGTPLDLSNLENPDGQITVTYGYDGNSRLVEVRDDSQNLTSFGYDALNRRTLQRNADGEEYRYRYDRDSNLIGWVDPNGSVVTNVFDALDRLVERTIERAPGVEGTTRETFSYDGLGRLTRRTDDNGAADRVHQVDYIYDSLSRRWEESQTVPRLGAAAEAGGFTRGDANADGAYDLSDAVRGLLLVGGAEAPCLDAADSNDDGQVDTSDAVYTLLGIFVGGPEPGIPFGSCGADPTEDALGCESYPPCEEGAPQQPSRTTVVVSMVWSGDGKRLASTYPGARRIENTFDAIDRIRTTSDASGLIAECFWIGPGYRELRRLCGNGTSLSFLDHGGTRDTGYDGVRRRMDLRCFLPDGVTSFLDREHDYNRADMRTLARRNDDSALSDRFTYDSAYHIVKTELDQDGSPGALRRNTGVIDYGLDGVGNRRTVAFQAASGAAQQVFTVNEVNEYTAAGATARTHDANGNLTDDGSRLLGYDYKNRLKRVAGHDLPGRVDPLNGWSDPAGE